MKALKIFSIYFLLLGATICTPEMAYSQNQVAKNYYPIFECSRKILFLTTLLNFKVKYFYEAAVSKTDCETSMIKLQSHLSEISLVCKKFICSQVRPSLTSKYIRYNHDKTSVIMTFENLNQLPQCESFSSMLNKRKFPAKCIGGLEEEFIKARLKRKHKK